MSTETINSRKKAPEKRRVFVNIEPTFEFFDKNNVPTQSFVGNQVYTSKYSLVSFIPKTLYEQFRRIANMFFLTLVVLQWFPEYQYVDPIVAALPLIIIVALTAAKDGVEDYRRHKTDSQVNSQITKTMKKHRNVNAPFHAKEKDILSNFSVRKKSRIAPEISSIIDDIIDWDDTEWKDIKVGDFILLKNNELIPADIIVMSTSDQDGMCYIESKNLDGETNLKIKRGIVETSFLNTTAECCFFGCYIDTEAPTPNLFTFSGNLTIPKDYMNYVAMKTENFGIECAEFDPASNENSGEEGSEPTNNNSSTKSDDLDNDSNFYDEIDECIQVPLNFNNILLRGCIIRNTDWIIGVIVATGTDTKLSLNGGDTPSKRSLIEKKMNPQIILNLILLTLMCIVTATASPLWESSQINWTNFVTSFSDSIVSSSIVYNWISSFFKSLITYQNVVPISLYLTVEFVKTIQAFLIYNDVEMYDEAMNTTCIPRSWNLADDLGQIQYIFSDKTGTLTRNIMEFKKCSINGQVYQTVPSIGKDEKSPKFYDPLLNSRMNDSADPEYTPIHNFFTALSVCHSVLVSSYHTSEVEVGGVEVASIAYKASSPDESALVEASRDIGFTFIKRELNTLLLNVLGKEMRFQLLNVLEFNSTRKRMSIIAKCPDGLIRIFCKGADSVICERLAEGQDDAATMLIKHMDAFGEDGLRTLCVASAIISNEDYEAWDKEYQAAALSLYDREDKIDDVSEKIEKNLTLLGSTAIEDKLQDQVPESIYKLSRAGIKIWVLTGDKVETALNIGFSCNLLKRDMNLILIKMPSSNDSDDLTIRQQMERALENFWGMTVKYTENSSISFVSIGSEFHPGNQHALIIDGAALKHALETDEDRLIFWYLATKCNSVLCCRVSPLQKAKVVELVKQMGGGAMCLAIGDGMICELTIGANDVGMIQAAHIGVGISGQEGLQAVMSSDYAIGQFKHLTRLLIVHGHWSYIRTAEMILCFFFKNLIYVMPLFWYQYLCGFSSQIVFEFSYLLLYNLLFASIPVAFLGLFERDLSIEYMYLIPAVYMNGVRNELFTSYRFLLFSAEGIYQSLVCFFFSIALYNEYATDITAHGSSNDELGAVMAICTILSSNAFIFLHSQSKSWPIFLSSFGSNILVLLWAIVYSYFPSSGMRFIGPNLFTTPMFYLTIIICLVTCILPRLTASFYFQLIKPSDIELIQELENIKSMMKVIHDDENEIYSPSSDKFKERKLSSVYSSGALKKSFLSESLKHISNADLKMRISPRPSVQSTEDPHRNPLVESQKPSIESVSRTSKVFVDQKIPLQPGSSAEKVQDSLQVHQPAVESTALTENVFRVHFQDPTPVASQIEQSPEQPGEIKNVRFEISSEQPPLETTEVARVHFHPASIPSIPSIQSSSVLDEYQSVERTFLPLHRANSRSDADGKSIRLTVMTGKMGMDARGFSFSESPGVRDLILGRTDIRTSPVRLDTIHQRNSTQSVPGRGRPRANTFTFGKKMRNSTTNISPGLAKSNTDLNL